MRVDYKGKSKDFNYRIAEVSFEDNELRLMERVEFALERVNGWKSSGICGNLCIFAVDDYEDYKSFVEDYKSIKKVIKSCMRFGF